MFNNNLIDSLDFNDLVYLTIWDNLFNYEINNLNNYDYDLNEINL